MTALEHLRAAAAQASCACGLLESTTAEALDGCSTALEAAECSLEALHPALPGLAGDPDALAEAWSLRRTVRRAAALLANAAAYHRDWQELVGVMTAGYGPGGRPGESPPSGRICLRG
jgi:hypothetical protein